MTRMITVLITTVILNIFVGAIAIAGSFSDNGDGTVTDNNTGCVWQQRSDGNSYQWEDALNYCENLSLGGYSNWKLPHMDMLKKVFLKTPAIYFNKKHPFYWSSTSSNASDLPRAWGIITCNQSIIDYPKYPPQSEWDHGYVICVQCGQ